MPEDGILNYSADEVIVEDLEGEDEAQSNLNSINNKAAEPEQVKLLLHQTIATQTEMMEPEELKHRNTEQIVFGWLIWLTCLPITVPLKFVRFVLQMSLRLTLFILSVICNVLCWMTSKVAALAINVPFIGDYLSQILSYPTECLGYSEAKDFSKGEN